MFKNIHLQLSEEDIKKIDDWKIERGMKSRTEAIRSMIRQATGTATASSQNSSLSENNNTGYMRPSSINDKNSIEEVVKEMVRKELEKMKD